MLHLNDRDGDDGDDVQRHEADIDTYHNSYEPNCLLLLATDRAQSSVAMDEIQNNAQAQTKCPSMCFETRKLAFLTAL